MMKLMAVLLVMAADASLVFPGFTSDKGNAMAINVNTGDGNNVDWDNTGFWQGGSNVGEMSKKWTNDFKDATQFTTTHGTGGTPGRKCV
jgi:hypothetical protein